MLSGVTHRPIMEIADELIANVSHGEFGQAFKSCCVLDTDTEDVEVEWVVIVAKGETARVVNEAYQAIVNGDERGAVILEGDGCVGGCKAATACDGYCAIAAGEAMPA